MEAKPKKITLSIIIPSFRQVEELKGALESIGQQTFKNYEILIIDGGSGDTIRTLVDKFNHLPIKLTSEPDQGIYDAMNKGIAKSNGEYLYFLGCDDRLASTNTLEAILGDEKNKRYDLIYGNVIFTVNNSVYDGKFSRLKLLSKNICHQSVFTKRSVFNLIGNFNTRYKYLADWVFNMECFNNPAIRIKYIDEIVALYNNAGSSSSFFDENFMRDRITLEIKFFPRYIRTIYYRKKGLVLKIEQLFKKNSSNL
jgi:glycosyltransferase involved in cell wall biosynthesis